MDQRRLLKGEIYMERIVNVTIERNETIELVFGFENELKLNLSSDKTKDTQKFFLQLLNEIVKLNETVAFILDDEKEDLFHDVADKYLKNLEYEIKKVVSEIPRRLLSDISV